MDHPPDIDELRRLDLVLQGALFQRLSRSDQPLADWLHRVPLERLQSEGLPIFLSHGRLEFLDRRFGP